MAGQDAPALPYGFPERVSGPMAWTGEDFRGNEDQYLETLRDDDIGHIEAATRHFIALGIPRGLASPITFPLPKDLSQRLQQITSVVYQGRGFVVLRGVDPSRYTAEERVVMYAGITSYVADTRARNIDHICDCTNTNPRGDRLKPLEKAVSMGFHTDTDVGDILTMFTQSLPEKGGNQYLSSIGAIYNTLATKDAKILKALADNWYWEKAFRPAIDREDVRVYNRPLISYEDGQLQVNFAATFIGGNAEYPLSGAAPLLSADQQYALDALTDAANQNRVRISQRVGDILFVNNYAILHARDGWVDSVESLKHRRYMMRLWLRDTKHGWKSATSLQRRLDDNFDLPPMEQSLLTEAEWRKLPRAWRVKSKGVSSSDCHD